LSGHFSEFFAQIDSKELLFLTNPAVQTQIIITSMPFMEFSIILRWASSVQIDFRTFLAVIAAKCWMAAVVLFCLRAFEHGNFEVIAIF
jgi:hypothetical protein